MPSRIAVAAVALGCALLSAGAAQAKVTLALQGQAVARGRFVRMADVAELSGDPGHVERLAKVVVSEAPAGRDIVDLRKDDIERRLAELGMRRDVDFVGAGLVRIYSPDAIDLTVLPEVTGRAPRLAMPGVAVLRPEAGTPELIPGLGDIRQTERIANAQFPVLDYAESAERTEGRTEKAEAPVSRVFPGRPAEATKAAKPSKPTKPENAARPPRPDNRTLWAGESPADDGDMFGRDDAAGATERKTRLWDDGGLALRLAGGAGASQDAEDGGAAGADPRIPETRASIVEAIKTYFADTCQAIGGQPVVSVRRWPESLSRATDWRVAHMAGGKIPGLGKFQLEGRGEGGNVVTLRLEAETAIEAPVALLRRSYHKDEIIREADVFVERRRIDPAQGFLNNPSVLAGQAAARNLSPLTPVSSADLVKPLWVKRRGMVRARAVHGPFTIDLAGIAMEDGRGGDTIVIQDGSSKGAKHYVKVTGPGQAEYVGPFKKD